MLRKETRLKDGKSDPNKISLIYTSVTQKSINYGQRFT